MISQPVSEPAKDVQNEETSKPAEIKTTKQNVEEYEPDKVDKQRRPIFLLENTTLQEKEPEDLSLQIAQTTERFLLSKANELGQFNSGFSNDSEKPREETHIEMQPAQFQNKFAEQARENISTTTVNVSIGKIEIKASQKRAPISAPRTVRPRKPNMSLKDYLARRNEG